MGGRPRPLTARALSACAVRQIARISHAERAAELSWAGSGAAIIWQIRCPRLLNGIFALLRLAGPLRYSAIIMERANRVPQDTSKESETTYLRLLREAPPWRKAAMVESLTRACQELAAAGIRRRYPTASGEEVRMRVAALWLDRDLMIRVFNWDPAREGY